MELSIFHHGRKMFDVLKGTVIFHLNCQLRNIGRMVANPFQIRHYLESR